MEFITSALGRGGSLDDGKPSLFELLSEAQLGGLLPATLRYLLTVGAHRQPRYLLRLVNRFDELYALGGLVVERHYLGTRGGSFTEHFYGLKREKAVAAEMPRASRAAPQLVADTLRLTAGDVWRNVAVLVGVPYLKRKLDEAYEVEAPRRLLGAAYNGPPGAGAGIGERLAYQARWFLRNVYPSVHAAYYFSLLAFQMAYLFDRSKYHNPFLWLLGTRVRRMNGTDYQAIEALTQPSPGGAGGRPGSGSGSILTPRGAATRMVGGLSLVLPLGIFALKFLEWWHASDFAKQLSRRAAEGLDLPAPVESRSGKDGPVAASTLLPIYTVAAPTDPTCCPICGQEIATATACQTGIVYCYTCIHRWIAGTHPKQARFMAGERTGRWESGLGRCAVTGRRVLGGTEGLRRVMV
ncbi:hypothetical protein P8C59_008541 [Phyllachora maydis]|uniref:Peroxisome assembly protein 12 n=1 Tax=Phyllachora maydis TaxID=1825666 RepID=A0AAD9MEP5_9PEZI|nr:hypothetical protein P8C59_008541 [Phyllachora maydis]